MKLKIPKFRRTEAKGSKGESMTVLEHLGELRSRIIKSAIAIIIGSVVAYFFYNQALSFFTAPYCHLTGKNGCSLYVTGPIDGFALRVKMSGYGGIFFASPVILWQLWRFITPGLHPKEKRYAIPFVLSSLLLFTGGALVAYYIFPHALNFLQAAGGRDLKQIYTPSSYLNLIIILMVAFGLSFEFPVLLVALEVARVVTPKKLASYRRWAIVSIVAVAAVVIPSSDPFSLFAMAIPLIVFYEVAIIIGRVLVRQPKRTKVKVDM